MSVVALNGDEVQITSIDDWYDVQEKLDTSVCKVELENGFTVELKPTDDSNLFVDFRRNGFIISFDDNALVLYEKEADADAMASDLSRLGTVRRIQQ